MKRTAAVAHLSIIIPVVDSQQAVDDTLVSVLENRPRETEVLVVHPQDYVDPYDLDDEVRLIQGPAEADWVSLFNLGTQVARGDTIHFLAPGMSVTPGWCDEITDYFEDRNVGAVVPLVKVGKTTFCGVRYDRLRGRHPLKSGTNADPLSPLLQSGFYRASALRIVRGFNPAWQSLADVELGIRLASASYNTVVCRSSSIVASSVLEPGMPQGYHGGALRSALQRRASAGGLDDNPRVWRGLLGELLIHRGGPSTLAAMAGRVFGRADVTHDESAVTLPMPGRESGSVQHRRAA